MAKNTTTIRDCVIDDNTTTISSKRPSKKAHHASKQGYSSYFVPAIPLKWIAAASNTPGSSGLKVALIIWRLWVMHNRKSFTFTTASAQRGWELTRNQKRCGLEALSEAGLIAVNRKTGRKNPIVTVLDKFGEFG